MANFDSNLNPHSYTINGVEVAFPAKAYPSQVAMMSKVILALQKSQNSLLESPTGSGKSLALLCAALAWQRKETRLAKEYNSAVEQGLIEPEDALPGADQDQYEEVVVPGGADTGGGFYVPEGGPEDDDFVNSNGFVPAQVAFPNDDPNPPGDVPNSAANNKPRKIKKKIVPKIYFGTRTHKQITQIIRELKKTAYKDVRMTILASREHTCINKTVMQMKNKTEGCRELTDRSKGGSCPFQANVKTKMSHHHAVNSYRGTSEAWDIEDIVKLGKKVRACPYYGTRELKNRSEIVFCPYNYLVEPLIRKSMEINLKGQIVILDEAHNIEDSARSAASWQVSQEDIIACMQDLERVVTAGIGEPESHREMALMCSQLSSFIDAFRDKLEDYSDFNSASKVWNGTDVCALFQIYGFGLERFGDLRRQHDKVLGEWQSQIRPEDEEATEEKNDAAKLKTPTVDLIENFILILGHLYMNDSKYRDDFRVALVRTQSRKPPGRQTNTGWMSKGGGNAPVLGLTYTVNFWCLNPAVTFHELKESIRSIVLTSGTLSPMASFSSELDVKFPIQLEANHVIDKKQVWIGTVSHGPTGHCLNATFRNAESFGFQDELGRLTLNVCQTIAHGVLIFLPSYRMLQNLSDRWQNTGTWQEICQKKVIITEPKNSSEFEASIRHFYEVIEMTSKGSIGEGTVDGALFMAVCRGKVSEGLDFADNNARAVICVGIPFPNVKDIQVDLKMRYNDHKKTQFGQQNILTGKEWYEIQAFRALNQALGRCIRHRRDWGAIIMVDDRFAKITRYLTGLSKWVRSGVIHYSVFNNMMSQLVNFNQAMVKMDDEYEQARLLQASLPVPEKPVLEVIENEQPNKRVQTKAPANKATKPMERFPFKTDLAKPTSNSTSPNQAKLNFQSLQKFKVDSDPCENNCQSFKVDPCKNVPSIQDNLCKNVPSVQVSPSTNVPSFPVIQASIVSRPILAPGQSDFLDEDSNDVMIVPESPTSSLGIESSPSSPIHFSKKPRLELKTDREQCTASTLKSITPKPNGLLASASGKKKIMSSQPVKKAIQYASDNSDDDFL